MRVGNACPSSVPDFRVRDPGGRTSKSDSPAVLDDSAGFQIHRPGPGMQSGRGDQPVVVVGDADPNDAVSPLCEEQQLTSANGWRSIALVAGASGKAQACDWQGPGTRPGKAQACGRPFVMRSPR